MDFRFTDDQLALRDLARGILSREVTPERLKAAETEGQGIDRALWATLADAHLLGVAIPEAHGGSGLGFLALCLLFAELGRAVAPVPALPALALAAPALAELGSEGQRARWLPALARGEVVLGAARAATLALPAVRARREGARFVLEGVEHGVAAGHVADRVLVAARGEGGVGLFLVDPRRSDVSLTPSRTSSGERVAELALRRAAVNEDDLVGGRLLRDPAPLQRLHDRALVALAATQLGVCERALEITAGYVAEREQFGVPVGSFQAVQHRAADAWVDLACLRWTVWRAAWRLDEALPAAREARVAGFWAADAGFRIAHSAQHLHAGIGVDRDYPVHRYYLWSRRLELELGGATPQLVELGRDLARTGPEIPA
jgi:alkylation response protein AidB-like acyl-CoA dehydrogenase